MTCISPYRSRLLTLFSFFILGSSGIFAQVSFTDQAGGFGPIVGRVVSNLGQPVLPGAPESSIFDKQGWELGLKSEIYRTTWMRGNLMASYVELGAKEWRPNETSFTEVDVNLKAVKAAVNPILFKVGNDFIHGYAGGGVYGTFFFDQEIESSIPTEDYFQEDKLKEIDYGLDLAAGIHIWSFDIEFHAQYSWRDIGHRYDDTAVRQEFYGLSIAYLYVNQNVTRKNCRNKKSLKKY